MLRYLFVLLFPVSAQATAWHMSHCYGAQYHFNKVAFGKEVKEVWVDTAVKLKHTYSTRPDERVGLQHFKLNERRNHFFGTTMLHAMSDEGLRSKGVVVQYWVYFKDGTQMVTSEVSVPEFSFRDTDWGQFESTCRALELRMDQLVEGTATRVLEVHAGYAD